MNKDMSDKAVKDRYEKAAVRAIAISDAVVFAALGDSLDLIKERKGLQQEIEKLKAEITVAEAMKNGK